MLKNERKHTKRFIVRSFFSFGSFLESDEFPAHARESWRLGLAAMYTSTDRT